jgi:YfiH family protein
MTISSENPSFRLTRLENGWLVGRFPALEAVAGVVHLVTTSQAIDVHVVRAQKASAADEAARACGLPAAAWVEQVHGPTVLQVGEATDRTIGSGSVRDFGEQPVSIFAPKGRRRVAGGEAKRNPRKASGIGISPEGATENLAGTPTPLQGLLQSGSTSRGLPPPAILRQPFGLDDNDAVNDPIFAGEADGLVTRQSGLGLVTRSADCPLILAADGEAGVVGTAHASWRSTVQQIAAELIRQMTAAGAAAEHIVACICPSAGPCCYQVGPEVLQAALEGIGPHAREFFRQCGLHGQAERVGLGQTTAFDPTCKPAQPPLRASARTRVPTCVGMPHQPESAVPHWYLDLWAANRDQLRRAGLNERNIHIAGVCTICGSQGDPDLFPSHRREGTAAGRFLALIGLGIRTEPRAIASNVASRRAGMPQTAKKWIRCDCPGRFPGLS